MNSGISYFSWVFILVFIVAFIIPIARVLKRVGHSPWLALLYAIPIVNLIFLWIFAFTRWPRDAGDQSKAF